ncbi:MAG: molecular chaperone HtpG, partial [Helicobacter sp.]|nr:molecular chaperone HtpG [Helicobacter sp.]
QEMPEPKKNVEININHELIQKIKDMPKDLRDKYCLILFNGAKILEGQSLKDSKSYVDSVHEMLLKSI